MEEKKSKKLDQYDKVDFNDTGKAKVLGTFQKNNGVSIEVSECRRSDYEYILIKEIQAGHIGYKKRLNLVTVPGCDIRRLINILLKYKHNRGDQYEQRRRRENIKATLPPNEGDSWWVGIPKYIPPVITDDD